MTRENISFSAYILNIICIWFGVFTIFTKDKMVIDKKQHIIKENYKIKEEEHKNSKNKNIKNCIKWIVLLLVIIIIYSIEVGAILQDIVISIVVFLFFRKFLQNKNSTRGASYISICLTVGLMLSLTNSKILSFLLGYPIEKYYVTSDLFAVIIIVVIGFSLFFRQFKYWSILYEELKVINYPKNKKLSYSTLFVAIIFFLCSEFIYISNEKKAFMEDLKGIYIEKTFIYALMYLLITFFLIMVMYYLKAKNEIINLERTAYRDCMTGVYIKSKGLEKIDECIECCEKNGGTFTLAFIDIDNLKIINDNFGHHEGDHMILSMINTIKSNIRKEDLIFRYGGDEFVIIFRGANEEEAKWIWERVEQTMEDLNRESDNIYDNTASIGFVQYFKGCGLTKEELIKVADKEMYDMKKNQKHQVKLDSDEESPPSEF